MGSEINLFINDLDIGNVTGGSDGKDLVVTFTSTANAASVQILLRSVTFYDTSDNPKMTRSLTLSLAGVSRTGILTVTRVNDPAVIGGVVLGTVVEAGGVNNATSGTPTATSKLTATDVDNPTNTFQAVSSGAASTGGYSTYSMTAGGVD